MANVSKLAQAKENTVKCRVCGLKVKNLNRHYQRCHTHSLTCLICHRDFSSDMTLLRHVKEFHAHMLGYLLPQSEVVVREDYPVNCDTLQQEIQRLEIPDFGGEWILSNDYAVSYDKVKMRPLVSVEILTPKSLEIVYDENKEDFPFLYDPDLPNSQVNVAALRKSNKHISHLASSANHRKTKDANDSTFLVRNLIYLHSNVNSGILNSVENQLNVVGGNWWRSVLVTIPVYDNRPTILGKLPEPTQIIKIFITGDMQLQVYVIPNSPDIDPEATNFVAVRDTLEVVRLSCGVTFQCDLPYAWDVPKWKCGECRFMTEDDVELGLHSRFEHKNQYCPVHRFRHKRKYASFEAFKQHVESVARKQCEFEGCLKWFYNQYDLARHASRVHVERTWECDKCKASFKAEITLDAHLQTHVENRTRISCAHCPLTFLTIGDLTKHTKMKHRQASATSPNRVNVRRSLRRHTSTPAEQIKKKREQITKHREAICQLEKEIKVLEQSSILPTVPIKRSRRN